MARITKASLEEFAKEIAALEAADAVIRCYNSHLDEKNEYQDDGKRNSKTRTF